MCLKVLDTIDTVHEGVKQMNTSHTPGSIGSTVIGKLIAVKSPPLVGTLAADVDPGVRVAASLGVLGPVDTTEYPGEVHSSLDGMPDCKCPGVSTPLDREKCKESDAPSKECTNDRT